MNVKVQLIGVLVLLVSMLPSEPAVSAERIVIGTPSRGLFEFPAVVAMRKGYYKDEGLDVDKVQMQPAIAVKALISGDIDYLLAWGSAVRAAVTGVPIKAVVGMASRPLHVLIARPDIKTPKDLKGKIIGVDSVAGTVDYLSRVAARHFGFEPENNKLQTQREQVKKVVRASLRGSRFMKQNRGETIQMLSDYLRITPSQAAKAYDTSINSFTDDGIISDKGVNLDLQLTKERLKMTKEIPLSQLVDWSLVKEIK